MSYSQPSDSRYRAYLTADSWSIRVRFDGDLDGAAQARAIFGAQARIDVWTGATGRLVRDIADLAAGAGADVEVEVGANLRKRKGNEINETGIARYRRIIRALDKAGITVEAFDGVAFPSDPTRRINWGTEYPNPYLTREAFEALIEAGR